MASLRRALVPNFAQALVPSAFDIIPSALIVEDSHKMNALPGDAAVTSNSQRCHEVSSFQQSTNSTAIPTEMIRRSLMFIVFLGQDNALDTIQFRQISDHATCQGS